MGTAAEGMQGALRKARALAAEALMQNFPELYILSAKALNEELNTTPHSRTLGQYLLTTDAELGTSPVEALAAGRTQDVRNHLAAKGGIDPASVRFVDLPAMPERKDASTEPRLVHITYCNYYATGEGVTTMIALGGTAESAKNTFLQSTPDYFHRGMVEDLFTDDAGPDTRRMQRWIPQPVLDMVATNPPGTTTYYASLHFNLA